ncbi:gamma-secretase subunit Aph-1 [Lingula anatina]|uniref:Gamma-secretase subunit Aph-1 n=1 Tax=Lingula anatina TaxID=7574 RepID=A0A1S3JE99_LINAN|nr:gamma-secretase subunit Aph-1 [Lingula anatina]|eukprot:XP_013408214.1 gamma-secretase subunit Aph-1 [Lingula anatina]
MALMEFFGCTFIAFGPPLALFLFTIARDPLRVIIMMASSFFWLLSLLVSSLLWFAVVPLRQQLAFGVVFSVLFQELFRFLFYKLLCKADEGLKKVGEQEEESLSLVRNKHVLAYVSGLGFGVISGAFSLVNVLADMSGPGTIGLNGESEYFFITSAFLTLAFIFLHTFWGVVFYAACDKKSYVGIAVVILSHMLVSCLTLLNQMDNPPYAGTVIPAYIVLLAMGMWAYYTAGGSLKNIKAFFGSLWRKPEGYNL